MTLRAYLLGETPFDIYINMTIWWKKILNKRVCMTLPKSIKRTDGWINKFIYQLPYNLCRFGTCRYVCITMFIHVYHPWYHVLRLIICICLAGILKAMNVCVNTARKNRVKIESTCMPITFLSKRYVIFSPKRTDALNPISHQNECTIYLSKCKWFKG
jgi:hypothetical protein